MNINEPKLSYTLDDLINELLNSFKNKNYLSALYIALDIPDVCKSLNGISRRNKKEYIAWCNKYLISSYNKVDLISGVKGSLGHFIYKARCDLFHSVNLDFSKDDDKYQEIDKCVFFLEENPNESYSYYEDKLDHNKKTLYLGISYFLLAVIKGVKKYKLDNPNINEVNVLNIY